MIEPVRDGLDDERTGFGWEGLREGVRRPKQGGRQCGAETEGHAGILVDGVH